MHKTCVKLFVEMSKLRNDVSIFKILQDMIIFLEIFYFKLTSQFLLILFFLINFIYFINLLLLSK